MVLHCGGKVTQHELGEEVTWQKGHPERLLSSAMWISNIWCQKQDHFFQRGAQWYRIASQGVI